MTVKRPLLITIVFLCVSVISFLYISGCNIRTELPPTKHTSNSTVSTTTANTTPSKPNEIDMTEFEEIVRDYNVVPAAQQTEFSGAVPLELALRYFIVHNRLGGSDCAEEYTIYDLQIGEGVLARYKIPKTVVEEYLLQHFSAIDFSGELGHNISIEEDCYILYGSGIGGGHTFYTFRDILFDDQMVTFLCDSRGDPQGEVFRTQKFTFEKKGDGWRIYAVIPLLVP